MHGLEPHNVRRGAMLLAAAGGAPLLALGAGAAKAAGLPQTAVAYQTTPKDGKQCDQCNFFVAPASCKLVAGDIAPSG
jgi:hypothetical protein